MPDSLGKSGRVMLLKRIIRAFKKIRKVKSKTNRVNSFMVTKLKTKMFRRVKMVKCKIYQIRKYNSNINNNRNKKNCNYRVAKLIMEASKTRILTRRRKIKLMMMDQGWKTISLFVRMRLSLRKKV